MHVITKEQELVLKKERLASSGLILIFERSYNTQDSRGQEQVGHFLGQRDKSSVSQVQVSRQKSILLVNGQKILYFPLFLS